MKILKLVHPQHGICAQEIIRGVFNEEKIKKMWANKYGKMILSCTYELYDDNPKTYFVIRNIRTGEIYENKNEALAATGINKQTLDKILGKKKYYTRPHFLVWIENKAI